MKIRSDAFENNQDMPSTYTCDGENISPALKFSEIPPNTKSLVLIVDDPDAPGKTWVHWTVYNIDPKIKEISENSIPSSGIEGRTDFGTTGYGGPCPPSGKHRYFFKLYALDDFLNITDLPTKEIIEETMRGHILEKAELIGLYSRR